MVRDIAHPVTTRAEQKARRPIVVERQFDRVEVHARTREKAEQRQHLVETSQEPVDRLRHVRPDLHPALAGPAQRAEPVPVLRDKLKDRDPARNAVVLGRADRSRGQCHRQADGLAVGIRNPVRLLDRRISNPCQETWHARTHGWEALGFALDMRSDDGHLGSEGFGSNLPVRRAQPQAAPAAMETAEQGHGLALAGVPEDHGQTIVCLRLFVRLVQECEKVEPATIVTKLQPAGCTPRFGLRDKPVARELMRRQEREWFAH